jgi:hypothetical protein
VRALDGITVCLAIAAACGGGQATSQSPEGAGDGGGDGNEASSSGASSGASSGSGSSSSSSSGASSGSGDAATGGDGGCAPVNGSGVFTAPNVWTKDVSCDSIDPSSATITGALAAAGGWGPGPTSFQIDTSLVVLHGDASTPLVPFYQASGYGTPDCDVFSTLPLPAGGAIEGSSGYTCDTSNNDCHLLVVHPPTHTLYEIYQATSQGSGIVGGCGVLWDLSNTYPDNLRGDQCTSADAAGFPMSAMLPDADEVASGAVLHAIRFALPNARIRAGVYVHPATHAGAPSGGATLPPYGVRMRLRADYPVSKLPSGAAQVLAVALQKYGMFLSDGGNIPLMVQGDQFTTHKWASLGFDTHMLFGIAPGDFDVVDLGPTIPLTYNCVRNP